MDVRVEQGGIIHVLEAGIVGRLGVWRKVVDGIKHIAEVGIHRHRLEERLLGSGRLDGHHHGKENRSRVNDSGQSSAFCLMNLAWSSIPIQ